MDACYRRLPLDGLVNARELGGFPTRDGKLTKYRVFVRSEAPRTLSARDVTFLRDYGVTAAVDFRGDRETEREPSCLSDAGWLRYLRSPTFNDQVAFATRGTSAGPPVTSFVDWRVKYVEMAEDYKGWVKATLELLASADGAVLYHCATGKDRTGVITALLLGLCGVSDADIIADYCVSELYLAPVYERLIAGFKKHWPDEPVSLSDPFFRTAPENMAALLRHLNDAYGGIPDYVEACGVDRSAAGLLRRRLSDA